MTSVVHSERIVLHPSSFTAHSAVVMPTVSTTTSSVPLDDETIIRCLADPARRSTVLEDLRLSLQVHDRRAADPDGRYPFQNPELVFPSFAAALADEQWDTR